MEARSAAAYFLRRCRSSGRTARGVGSAPTQLPTCPAGGTSSWGIIARSDWTAGSYRILLSAERTDFQLDTPARLSGTQTDTRVGVLKLCRPVAGLPPRRITQHKTNFCSPQPFGDPVPALRLDHQRRLSSAPPCDAGLRFDTAAWNTVCLAHGESEPSEASYHLVGTGTTGWIGAERRSVNEMRVCERDASCQNNQN